ncbi:hypothetical protein [Streptomyces graminilatus]|uniref:hypothetical protein n=1 Tax=Streptomyces graminilatus TaxID=1464070 RepID=UPI0006E3F4AA|nr:hypothetical protein [Streptomyces graminilatus]
MAGRRPQPRRITLGGREAVALTVAEYERLLASRRQVGGQSARVRVLAQQVKRTEQLLRDLETLVEAPPDDSQEPAPTAPGECTPPCRTAKTASRGQPEDCLRCAIAALLRRHREPDS